MKISLLAFPLIVMSSLSHAAPCTQEIAEQKEIQTLKTNFAGLTNLKIGGFEETVPAKNVVIVYSFDIKFKGDSSIEQMSGYDLYDLDSCQPTDGAGAMVHSAK